MKTPYLDEMINELDGYIGSSDNYLSKKGNEKLTELKAIKKQLLLYNVVGQSEQLCGKPNCTRQKLENSPLCTYHWDISNS